MSTPGIAFVMLGCLVYAFIDCKIINTFKYSHHVDEFVVRYLNSLKFKRHIDIILDQQIDPTDSDIILKAYKSYHPVIITDPKSESPNSSSSIKNCYKMHNIIGIFRRAHSIQPSQWRSFYGNNCWNSAASIAIWITNLTDLDDLELMLIKFWHSSSINVVALVLNEFKNETTVYTYDPFAFKNANSNSNSDQERGRLYEITDKGTLFSDKLKNLNGYLIPISLYQHQPHARLDNNLTELADGKDVNYYRFLSQWMNFSIVLKTAKVSLIHYIVDLPNKTRVNVIGDIITNRSIFIGNAVHWEIINTAVVDIVYPHWRSKIIVVIPQNDPIPGIFLILQSNSGVTLVLTLAAIIGLMIYLMICKEDNIMLKILKLLLFQSVDKIGEKSPARIFWISLIYWAFLLVTIFQSQLINDLSAPEFYDDMDTLDELDKSNFTLMTKEWEYEALNSSMLESKRRLLKQTVVEVDFRRCLSLMKKSRNVACTIDGSYAKYIKSRELLMIARGQRYNTTNKFQVHFMDQPLVSYWKTYAVKKDSPYLQKMNKAAIQLVEKGIMKKWYNDDVKKHLKIGQSQTINTNIGLEGLNKVFLIYLFGNLVAGGCFVIEVVYYKFKKNRSVESSREVF